MNLLNNKSYFPTKKNKRYFTLLQMATKSQSYLIKHVIHSPRLARPGL